MLQAVKIRLYPNNNQATTINKLLGSYRMVYNNCLNLKKEVYLKDKTNLGLSELGIYFHQTLTKNPDYSWLKEHNTKVLKQAIINLLDSYKRFFVNGTGFPKFKSKHEVQSCRFPCDAISKKNNYSSFKITLTSQLSNIKFSCSKKYTNLLDRSTVKSATLTKTKTNKYFLSILIDTVNTKVLPITDKTVGIDLGIKTFIVTSDNKEFANIKIKRSNAKKIARLHRKHSKRVNKSKNKEKSKLKLARYYEKLNNQKNNYLHNVSNQLISENQTIVVETLKISNMLKNRNLAKSIQELSLCKFRIMLEYKCAWYNKTFVKIDQWFPSSKLCSNCQVKNTELNLSDREWTCKSCSTTHSRDFNAAINIRNEGLRILNIPIRNRELTPLESKS